MPFVYARAAIQCSNESLLLHEALKNAQGRGIVPQTYLDVRRQAPSTLLFDVETIIKEALSRSSCSVVNWDSSLIPVVPTGDVEVIGDIIAFSSKTPKT